MTAEENRSAANLILLCLQHANEIDLPENVDRFPADLLRQWKAEQITLHDAAAQGWELSEDEVEEVLSASNFTTITSNISIQGQTINLGGQGGNAPGGGGGGGAAIGPGALGGPGGPGGGGPLGRIELNGSDGAAPGAGGGGGGCIAPGAILPDPSAPPRGTEGRGYSAGLDGQDGGDTTISVGDEVLVRAVGGKGGLAGTGVRRNTEQLSVSCLLLCNYVEIHAEGLASLAGAGWQSCHVLNLPSRIGLAVFILFEAGGVETGEYTVNAEVRDPLEMQKSKVSFPVTVTAPGDLVRIPRWLNIAVEVNSFGIWRVVISTPSKELAHLDLMVRRTGVA